MTTLGTGGMFSGVNSFPLMTPIRPSGMIPMSTRPDGLDHSTCVNQYPAGLIFQYPRIRMSFPVLVEYSAKPYRPFQAWPGRARGWRQIGSVSFHVSETPAACCGCVPRP